MPKVEATVTVLTDVANELLADNINTLSIKRYKSGKNAGKLFAEYTLQYTHTDDVETEPKRRQVAELIQKAAQSMSNGRSIELLIQKYSSTSWAHRLEIKGE